MEKLLLLFFIISVNPEPEVEFSNSGESPLLSTIRELRASPLNLNTCTLKALKEIPFITDETAKNIYRYRKLHKGFRSKSELLLVSGITPLIYDRVKDFFFISEKRRRPINRIEARIQYYPQRGIRNWERLKLKNRLFSANIISEKDPEEINYIDYISGNILIKKYNIIFGDYDVNIGEGMLISSQIFNFPLSGIPRIKSGIKPHTTSIENLFYRGIAFENNHILLSLSRNGIDSRQDSISVPVIFSPHIGNVIKDGITEDAGILFLKFAPISIGSGYFSYTPDVYGYKVFTPVDINFKKSFSAQNLSIEGLYLKHLYLASRFSAGENPYFLFFYRYLPDSLPLHSGIYHRFTRGDEEGLYIYSGFTTPSGINFSGYFDTYHHISLRDNYCFKYGLNLGYYLMKGLLLSAYSSGTQDYIKMRGQMDILGKGMSLRLRYERINKFSPFQDGAYAYISLNIKSIFEVRYIAIQNPFNLPIYEYESDLPGVMRSIYASGEGRRYYILLHHKIKGSKVVFKFGLDDKEKMDFTSGIYGGFQF